MFLKRRPLVIPVHAGGTDMDIAFNAVFQREVGDQFDAVNVGWIEGFIRCGKIADRSQVEYPVDAAFKEPGQRFRLGQVAATYSTPNRSKNEVSFLGRAEALVRTPFRTRNSTR